MCAESLAGTVDDVVAYYRDVLASRSGGKKKTSHLKRFDTLLANNKAAAHAEAAVFDFLDLHHRLAPEIFEDASTGGPDFECTYGQRRFAVEVTSIGDVALTRRSNLPHDAAETSADAGAAFIDVQSLMQAFDSRLSAKNAKKQARVYDGPQVLAIVSTHIVSSVVPAVVVENFVREAFLKHEGRSIVPVRRAYGLILFVQVTGDASFVVGAVHPAPTVPLGIEPFRRIPFARVAASNFEADARLLTEWVVAQPEAHKSIYLPLELRRFSVG